MMAPAWQIALAVLCGYLIGALCGYVAFRITSQGAGGYSRGQGAAETVGADAQGQQDGAPQGRPTE